MSIPVSPDSTLTEPLLRYHPPSMLPESGFQKHRSALIGLLMLAALAPLATIFSLSEKKPVTEEGKNIVLILCCAASVAGVLITGLALSALCDKKRHIYHGGLHSDEEDADLELKG